jgi:hypothetical protein
MNSSELFSDIPYLLSKNPQYLIGITWEVLEQLPVISEGHFSKLIFQSKEYRVFISRLLIGNYGINCSDAASEVNDRLIFIEQLISDEWVCIGVRVCDGLHDGFNRYRLQIQATEEFGSNV